jgi:L-amino acid N-acyltransferase YncA
MHDVGGRLRTTHVGEACGKGLGSALYAALFAALEREDVHRIVAGISLPNAASLSLHERFGFRPVGVFHSVGRKFDRFWDVAWLSDGCVCRTRSSRSGPHAEGLVGSP